MPTLQELADLGQSVWLDTLSRKMINSGELQSYIDKGVRGVTANPTILEKAIVGSSDYDEDINRFAHEGLQPLQIYENMVFSDIGRAADMFYPVYLQTEGVDGYVSLEVSPHKAYDTVGTVEEVQHLFSSLNRPNIFIKVPATAEGVPAIEQLVSDGINVNVTLIFSLSRYREVAEAYLRGLERRLDAGLPIDTINSVASFFVSRVDTMVDKRLEQVGELSLIGHIAIGNARLAYAIFREIISSERWQRLADNGALAQRPLWASTGTKNPDFPTTLYVDQLIGPDTVNTMPISTLKAFFDHGSVAQRIDKNLDRAEANIARLAELGISLDDITQQLEHDGVEIFAKSFDNILVEIGQKCHCARENMGRRAA